MLHAVSNVTPQNGSPYLKLVTLPVIEIRLTVRSRKFDLIDQDIYSCIHSCDRCMVNSLIIPDCHFAGYRNRLFN